VANFPQPTQITAAVVMDSFKALLQSIAQSPGVFPFAGKVLSIYDDDDLANKMSGVTPPVIGLMYEGLVAAPIPDQKSARQGLSGHLVASVVLAIQYKPGSGSDVPTRAIDLLDLIRSNMRDVRSPTGHFWEFMVEAPADKNAKLNLLLWVQRWRCPIQLPGTRSL
jgi:hypothetical protein